MSEWTAIEIWADMNQAIPYVLIVMEHASGKYEILDPHENNRICFSHDDYRAITAWLNEDEFDFLCRSPLDG